MEKVGRGTILITEQTIEFNEPMRSFVLTLETGQPFGREDYVQFFQNNISEKTARLDIGKLLDGNWLEKTGEGPAIKYIRTTKKLPD